MSFASTLRPVGISFNSPLQHSTSDANATNVPFHNEPNYLQLQRMLTRYQSLVLFIPSPIAQDTTLEYELSPLQRRIRAELYSPLPYHRTKWLHSIESARNLLLCLEQQVQGIKTPRAKKEALKDLAGKRQIIKRLKNRVEEIGRHIESLRSAELGSRNDDEEELLGERADAVLFAAGRDPTMTDTRDKTDEVSREGRTVNEISEETEEDIQIEEADRKQLFGSSLRKRQTQGKDTADTNSASEKGTTSGFSNLAQTERSLQTHAHEHENLTSALVSMAAQLKQQSRAFQFSLTQDEGFLNRAVEGLDLNITSMEAASKNMAFLRRMSEEQGFFGRLKLYGIILALWVFAVLLVFVGPKLRF